MTCSTAEPFLLDAPADLAPDVRAHLAACAECSRLRADLLDTGAELRAHLATPVPETLTPDFLRRSQDSRLAPDRAPARLGSRRARWATAAALVAESKPSQWVLPGSLI